MPKTAVPQGEPEPTTAQKVWRFVEKYYPDYDHSDEIGRSDTLQKIVDNEFDREDEDDSATAYFNELREDTDTDAQAVAQAQTELNELLADIYERSIEAFLDKQKPSTDILLFGSDAVALHNMGKPLAEVVRACDEAGDNYLLVKRDFPNKEAKDWYYEGMSDQRDWYDVREIKPEEIGDLVLPLPV